MCHTKTTRRKTDYNQLVAMFKDGVGYSVKLVVDGRIGNLFYFQEALYHRVDTNGVWYSSIYEKGIKSSINTHGHFPTRTRFAGYHLTNMLGAKTLIHGLIRKYHFNQELYAILKVQVLGFRSYGWAKEGVPSLYCHRYKPISIIAIGDTVVNNIDVPIQFVEGF